MVSRVIAAIIRPASNAATPPQSAPPQTAWEKRAALPLASLGGVNDVASIPGMSERREAHKGPDVFIKLDIDQSRTHGSVGPVPSFGARKELSLLTP